MRQEHSRADCPAELISGSPSSRARAAARQHPAIWRGRSAARVDVVPTGFTALDESLPGGAGRAPAWSKFSFPRLGVGEMSLLLPALAALTQRPSARWCAWISPPFQPFAPAARGAGREAGAVVRCARGLSRVGVRAVPDFRCLRNGRWPGRKLAGSGTADLSPSAARRGEGAHARRAVSSSVGGSGVFQRGASAARAARGAGCSRHAAEEPRWPSRHIDLTWPTPQASQSPHASPQTHGS